MDQRRGMSLVEALATVVTSYGFTAAAQLLVFPPFGVAASLELAAVVCMVFVVINIIAVYLLRRGFETLRDRS